MRTTTVKLLRFAFVFALVAACFGLAACANSGSSGGDSAASSAAEAASSAASSEAASAEASSGAASSGAAVSFDNSWLGSAPEVEKEKNPDAVAGVETAPALMPASHESYLSQAELPCQTCHGVDASGTPKNASAAEVPKGHYVNEDPSTGELDPARAQCISCHVVDPAK